MQCRGAAKIIFLCHFFFALDLKKQKGSGLIKSVLMNASMGYGHPTQLTLWTINRTPMTLQGNTKHTTKCWTHVHEPWYYPGFRRLKYTNLNPYKTSQTSWVLMLWVNSISMACWTNSDPIFNILVWTAESTWIDHHNQVHRAEFSTNDDASQRL